MAFFYGQYAYKFESFISIRGNTEEKLRGTLWLSHEISDTLYASGGYVFLR